MAVLAVSTVSTDIGMLALMAMCYASTGAVSTKIHQIRLVMVRTLSTSDFAKALGISESSVRRMTDAGELQIHRTRGGHRRIPVPEAIRYVRETKSRIEKPELFGLTETPSDGSTESAESHMLAVLRGGHAASVTSLMQSLYAGGMSIAEICDKPVFYAMQQIGNAWPHDKKAIFIEHRAMVLCCRALNQLRLSISEPELEAPQAIGGSMSGDIYLLPTLMASLVLYDLGFNETNLGPNLPLDVLTDCVQDERPALVWLAISEPLRSRTQLQEVVKLAEAAKLLGTLFIVGGRHARDLEIAWGEQPASWVICQNMQDLVAATRPCLLNNNNKEGSGIS